MLAQPIIHGKPRLASVEKEIVLSVIVPFFNEAMVLPTFHQRLTKVLDSLPELCEIIYVDDGSQDNSRYLLSTMDANMSIMRTIVFSRNFGKEAAMSAGLQASRGQAVILIDADLQDPPELIPDMLAQWREGYKVVNMQRCQRHGETWFKRFSAACFYRFLNSLSKLDIPENVGDFRLLSREVVEHVNQLPECSRYMKGIFAWPGFEATTLSYERDARHCGESKWGYFKLLGLALDGITSFSIRPLRLATITGALVALSAFIYGLFVVIKTLVFGEVVSGYPSLMTVQLAIGGIQLLCIGLMGEYIGRIFIEAKQRPLYVIQSTHEQAPQPIAQEVVN